MWADKLSARLGQPSPWPQAFTPMGVAMAINLMGSVLGFESALGIAGGHEEAGAIAAWCLRELEPDAQPQKAAPPVS